MRWKASSTAWPPLTVTGLLNGEITCTVIPGSICTPLHILRRLVVIVKSAIVLSNY